MNIVGTKCIGNQLVRMFGKGPNLKRVVTETVDGKTLTHVFDADGKRIISRAKSFAKEAVGNKVVNTRTEVRLQGEINYKLITDRVYSQNGELLGIRAVSFENGSKDYSGKQAADSARFVKCFRVNNTVADKSLLLKSVGSRYSPFRMDNGFSNYICCNSKGLPMPLNSMPKSDMTIREMKSWMAVNKPDSKYLPEGFGPKSLNDITPGAVTAPVADKVTEFNEALKAFFL